MQEKSSLKIERQESITKVAENYLLHGLLLGICVFQGRVRLEHPLVQTSICLLIELPHVDDALCTATEVKGQTWMRAYRTGEVLMRNFLLAHLPAVVRLRSAIPFLGLSSDRDSSSL